MTPISDHGNYLFVFPTAILKQQGSQVIYLHFSDHRSYTLNLDAKSTSIALHTDGSRECWDHVFKDRNTVIRIVHTGSVLSVYANGEHKGQTTATDPASFSLYSSRGRPTLDVTVIIFDKSEGKVAEMFALLYFADPTTVVEQMRTLLADGGIAGGGSEGDGAGYTCHPFDVQPPDFEELKDSANKGWPRAVKYVLTSAEYATVKARYDTLMSEWVRARGDNISSNTYDYVVYSHGVAWPKVVDDIGNDADVAMIWEKHKEYSVVL